MALEGWVHKMALSIATRPVNIDGCWAAWTEQARPDIIRTQMENNTVKVRRRTTGNHRNAEVARTHAAEDYQGFIDWFNVACQQGILPTWIVTPYGVEEVWRFSEPPSISWKDPKAFEVQCKFEQLSGWLFPRDRLAADYVENDYVDKYYVV